MKMTGLRKVLISFFIFSVFSTPFFSFAKNIYSLEKGGDWNNPETWVDGQIPKEEDDVYINGEIKWPREIVVKSIKLVSGIQKIERDLSIKCKTFEIGENAILKGYKKLSFYKTPVLDIESERIINNGKILEPLDINTAGVFINNGEIIGEKNKFPKIIIKNTLENNSVLDKNFNFIFYPNTEKNKYYILGKVPANIQLIGDNDLENFYFKSDLDLNVLSVTRKVKIVLDQNRILRAQEGIFNFVIPNENILIVGSDKQFYYGVNIDAPKTDIFLLEDTDITGITARNIYVNKNKYIFS